MAYAPGPVPNSIVNNRRIAANAILLGYDDGDVATVISDAQTAGYKTNAAVVSSAVGGIIGSVNR